MTEQLIPLIQIHDNPKQHRGQYSDIESLARGIAEIGLQQSPKARKNGKGYELKFGHRRKRAFEWLSQNWKREGLTDRYNGYTVMPLEIEDLTDKEMFDAMIMENMHRADLKPTEVAFLLKQYQGEYPEATSKEIGLKFNMNESTVRGMVRLLELTEDGKKALDDGKISQGTARTLLSMQKIAPEAAVKETLKRIEKNPDVLPDEVIDDMVNELPDAIELFIGRHADKSEKPRAGGRGGWLLDMKNFPNNLLPEIDASDLKSDKADHLKNPPTCAACPFSATINGSHYCGVKACFDRKQVAWAKHVLEQNSKETKIAIYTDADGTYRPLDGYYDKALFEKRDKGLRLVSGRTYETFKGINTQYVSVVATGDALNKLKTSHGGSVAAKGKKTEKEKAEMRAMKLYRQLRKEVMWEYCGVAQKYFDGIPLSVLEYIEQHTGYVGVDEQIPDTYEVADNAKADAKMEFKRREIVWNLIFDLSSHYRREPLIEQLEAFADRMSIPAPKALINKTKNWDAEIDALTKVAPVSVATPKKATKKG